jgi:hypothetical protein
LTSGVQSAAPVCPVAASCSPVTYDSAARVPNVDTRACGQLIYQEIPMMKPQNAVSAALIMSALLVALSGCQKKEGPAEQAGKELDQATEKVGEQIEKAGDKIQDTAKGDKE